MPKRYKCPKEIVTPTRPVIDSDELAHMTFWKRRRQFSICKASDFLDLEKTQ